MQLGEVVYGGVGSGLYGMLILAILAVFIAGLWSGARRSTSGKKIGSDKMKMAVVVNPRSPLRRARRNGHHRSRPMGLAGLQDSAPHGFSEILYAFSSMGNNNGSAFAGYTANNSRQHLGRRCDDRIAVLACHPGARHRRRAGRQ